MQYHAHVDREQVARLTAQLMKTQNDLNAERKINYHLRKTSEAEHWQKTEIALSSSLTNLLQKQVEGLALKAKNEATAQDLQYRDRKIEQLEIFLSEGQKQFKYELDKRGLRPVDAVEREHIRREAELALKRDIAVVEEDLKTRFESLRLREGVQKMREEQYKVLIWASVETELREKAVSPEKVTEIAEVEYNDGYAAGKIAARKDADKEGRRKGFLEGYAACYTAQSAVANLRSGRISYDSKELEFLFDPTHPHNPYNIGLQLGTQKTEKAEKEAVTAKQEEEEKEEEPRSVNDEKGAMGKTSITSASEYAPSSPFFTSYSFPSISPSVFVYPQSLSRSLKVANRH